MEPEAEGFAPEAMPAPRPQGEAGWKSVAAQAPAGPSEGTNEYRGLRWAFIGNDGLRAGWSVLIFWTFYRIFLRVLETMTLGIDPNLRDFGFSAKTALIGESVPFFALLGAAAIISVMERRGILDFNLKGARRTVRFFSGSLAGFVALSALVGAMDWGGWLHFGTPALHGARIAEYAAVWGCAFLLVGCVEEGLFRCYLQFTLTRGINFWWASGIICVLCLDLVLRSHGNEGILSFVWFESLPAIRGTRVWGVYAVALAGLPPCLWLYLRKSPQSGFWQAAWVTSTLFGFIHTGNNGENWIGIFAAALIGFVFCVSVWATGSAWWAIGCHAGWDWAESYFYGTADSGFVARGHFLSTTTTGNPLWSGGTDGPEGSLLVIGIVLLLLAAILLIYRRATSAQPVIQSAA